MDINQVIQREYVLPFLKSKTRDEALKELIAAAQGTGKIASAQNLLADILEREAAFTTKIMEKIAIPHAKSGAVKEPLVFVGKSVEGIVWDPELSVEACPPEDRVYLVFLILVPGENENNEHLKLLATLARCLSHASFRESIHNSDNPEEIIRLIGDKMAEIAAR